jgi:hypothetical protein
MGKFFKILLFISIGCSLVTTPLYAEGTVNTNVKVIYASTDSNHVDAGLKNDVSELKSVFRYTSYRLINSQALRQQFNQQGQVQLPGNRSLMVTPTSMQGKRIRYQINIQKGSKSIFQTQVLLKNNDSITIGGPQYENGVLLFNIMGSAR